MKALRDANGQSYVGAIALGLLALLPPPAWSANLAVPNSFTANTPARASEVNANFNATAAAVNSKQDRVTGSCPSGQSIQSVNADGTVACEPGLADKVDKAGDTMTGPLTAPDFTYSTPKVGQVIALPNTCMRILPVTGTSINNFMHLEMGSVSPGSSSAGNSWGPSINTTNPGVNQTFRYFCPIPLQVPAGAAVTITGATLGYVDQGFTCRVQAELKSKPFGISSSGTGASVVYSGINETDFTAADPGPQTKAFPSFTLDVPSDLVVWVEAIIASDAGGGGDCRYSGVLVDYAVNKP